MTIEDTTVSKRTAAAAHSSHRATRSTSTMQHFYALLAASSTVVILLFLLVGKSPGAEAAAPSAAAEVECAADGTCAEAASKQQQQQQQQHAQPECTVYMAPSTLGVDSSMGIYTAVPLESGVTINFPEIAIPLLFRDFNEHAAGFEDGILWDRYIWEGDVVEIETYVETNRDMSRAVFVPGVGCTVNSVLDMNNIESTHGSEYSTAGLHRSKDPGSGAFTPYHNSKTVTSEAVAAGAELFASYGDYWIPDIPGAQIALEALMNEADAFLRDQYYPFLRDHTAELTPDLKQALWEFATQDFPVFSQAFTNFPRNVPWSDVEDFMQQQIPEPEEDGSSSSSSGAPRSVVREFMRRQSVRSPEWLQQNGYCQDHLKPDRSTIQQAGRGAFASRTLPAGTVVGYAPLVHMGLHGRDILTVTVESGGGGGGDNKESSSHKNKQFDLVLNYSFGHRNSTVLLTPYGAGVNYINHGGKDKANVRLQWPDKELIAHKPEFLTRTPEALSNTIDKIGLSFEYVAIRDIEEGEEVFLDYGEEWEKAWEEHVAQWKPVENAFYYVHSSEWEEDTYRTVAEQEKNPYPSNLHTMCHESYTYSASDDSYQWVDLLRALPLRVYCNVLERSGDEDDVVYTVELELEEGETVIVHNVPEQGIFLYDRAFSADWHLPNVFRHEIAIPDDIMPAAWMNGPPPPPREDP